MKMKKTLSLFLALAMTASMPFAVLATEVDPNMQVSTENNTAGMTDLTAAETVSAVAKIKDKTYNTLEEAVNGAVSGDTITLLSDVADGSSIIIPAGKNLTLDFGGKTYTVTNANALSRAASPYGFRVDSTMGQNSTVAFTNGAIVAGNSSVVFVIENSANIKLSNIQLAASSGKYALTNKSGAAASVDNASVVVNGEIDNAGTLTVKGGNFNGNVANNGTLTVEKGKFAKDITGNGTLTVTGGNFDGNISAANGQISGGAFSIKPDDKFLASNMKFELLDPNSGKYVVGEKNTEDGNTPLAPPATVEKAENYITVNADAALANALKGIGLNIDNADLVKNVKPLTKNEALDFYKKKYPAFNDADVAKLSISAEVYVDVKGNVVSTESGKESFTVGITPTVATYVENEKKEKAPVEAKSFTAVTSAGVTIPVPDQFASVKEFTVTQNGTPVAATMSGKNIVLSGIKDFYAPFTITAKQTTVDDKDLPFPAKADVKINTSDSTGHNLGNTIKGISLSPNLTLDFTKFAPIKESDARKLLNNNTDPVRLTADIVVNAEVTAYSFEKSKEYFTLKLDTQYNIYATTAKSNETVEVGKNAVVVKNGTFAPASTTTVTLPLPSEFAKIKGLRGKFTIKNAINNADKSSSSSNVAFDTNSLNDYFYITAPAEENKPTPPSGYEHEITVLDGTYIIKNKELIKTDSNNTVKFDESAYIVVVKGGYAENTDAKYVDADDFLTKDDVSKIRMGSVKFEENGKLIDGKISWQAKMIKVDGRNKGVYLIEIPIKKNSGYTSSKDIFGNFELRASKPYYFGSNGSATETKENVNFYVEVDADVNTDTDEIYDGTHVYEFNDMEDDEIILYGGDGTFIVDTRGQGKLVIKTDVKYNEGIEKANPDANYVYYNSNYPTFNRLGYLYLKANRGDKIYKVDRDTGRLTKMSVPYDRDMEAFKIRTRTLGCYVVAEKELDLDRINGIIDPQPVNPPVTPPSIINPPTGAEI